MRIIIFFHLMNFFAISELAILSILFIRSRCDLHEN